MPEVDARLCKERKIFALHDLNGCYDLKDAIDRVHAAGKKVGVWVWSGGDKKASYRLLRELGVDNFGTDYPETMLEFLKEER